MEGTYGLPKPCDVCGISMGCDADTCFACRLVHTTMILGETFPSHVSRNARIWAAQVGADGITRAEHVRQWDERTRQQYRQQRR
jgi:hypothetical protein